METTSYIALSRQMVLRRNMDVIANNIANMTSSGYRAEALLMEHAPVDVGPRQTVAYVQDVAVVRDLTPGSLRPTGNPFDLAIEGPGYFTIETAEGERYSRGGQFRLNEQGELTTPSGDLVVDDGGAPITVPLDADAITVSPDGTISAPGQEIGQFQLVTFADRQDLKKVGDGLYRTDQAPVPAEGSRIVQGMLEGSNVRPIVEMTDMMATTRAYQSTQRLIDNHHELQRRAIERMLETNG